MPKTDICILTRRMYRKRNRNRLLEYDYSLSGSYFVTVCVKARRQILSSIVVGDGLPVPKLKPYGIIVDKYIHKISQKYTNVKVDKYIIMPDHIHLLISIKPESGTENPSPTISSIMGWFKYQTTKEINSFNKQ